MVPNVGEFATKERDATLVALTAVQTALSATSSGSLLDEIAWSREVEARFFEGGADALPEPTYEVDRAAFSAERTALERARDALEGEGPIHAFLLGVLGSSVDKLRLLEAIGTDAFGAVSRDIYGGSRTLFLGRSKLDLAQHLLERLSVHGWDRSRREAEPTITSEDLAARFEAKAAARRGLELRVVVDDTLTSKAIAGATRVRVRRGAMFSPWEADGLFRHEVETHAYSAQNGLAQRHMPFLRSGGPRSTETQEGLAVFAELHHGALATPRLRRLALRVKVVAMAEDGADFLEVYRYLERFEGLAPRDAFLDASRVFRGGDVRGRSVFTKDTVYISGLMRVYAFLSVFVRGGFRDECELVMAGRIDLDDVLALVRLDRMGLVVRPKLLPKWLREWDTLLPYFAFMSFVAGIDLAPVERSYEGLVVMAEDARRRG
ncbi:MAG: DUF1704 domain-containing protein [Myxococcales bacterium]|nr:DUF1704 domain-containing protein [Myxococcales bacterium]